MAQLIGTGQDIRYPEGVAFDVPESSQQALIDELVSKGAARYPEPGPDDQRRVEIANGVVRGDPLSLPEDRVVAAEIEDRGTAHDIVHTGEPGAKKGAHDLDPEVAADRTHKVQPLARTGGTPTTASPEAKAAEKGGSKEGKEAAKDAADRTHKVQPLARTGGTPTTASPEAKAAEKGGSKEGKEAAKDAAEASKTPTPRG